MHDIFVEDYTLMMKKFLFFTLLLFCFSFAFSQSNEAQHLYDSAKRLMNRGDFENATVVLESAMEKSPDNYEMMKSLAFLDYLKKDYAGSIDVCKILISHANVDEQAYQILGMNYKAIAQDKECAKMYKEAIKKFPASGVLYNEYGELLAAGKNMIGAIEQWEKGIEAAPSYSSNYFNAVNFYAQNNNLVKELIYGEVFLNLESYTTRTASVKTLLLNAYTKLYTSGFLNTPSNNSKETTFAQLFTETLSKTKSVSFDGALPEILTAVRARFILDWYGLQNNTKYPFHLFDYMQYLLHEGYFEAYNQWIFGAAQSPADYQTWIDANTVQATNFTQFQQGRVFKMPEGQYYQ